MTNETMLDDTHDIDDSSPTVPWQRVKFFGLPIGPYRADMPLPERRGLMPDTTAAETPRSRTP